MLDARFSHLYFCQSLYTLQSGLAAIADLLVITANVLLLLCNISPGIISLNHRLDAVWHVCCQCVSTDVQSQSSAELRLRLCRAAWNASAD